MPELKVGDRVKIVALPPYIKTADPMPMLRSASILAIGEEGIVIDRRPAGYWGIRFPQGAFLMENKHLELI